MAISEFVSTELVSRANINNRITQANLCFPVSLYNNASGTSGTVPLSDSAANYNYLEIYFKDNDDIYNSIKAYNSNGKKLSLITIATASTATRGWIKNASVSVSGSTITFEAEKGQLTIINNGNSTIGNGDYILICSVIGYKY
ncbi:MAG: hypothetical protein IKQ46_10620 [Bacteroidales bacterium]|nr:hypothetical protein [Bacteroidales bacterium]